MKRIFFLFLGVLTCSAENYYLLQDGIATRMVWDGVSNYTAPRGATVLNQAEYDTWLAANPPKRPTKEEATAELVDRLALREVLSEKLGSPSPSEANRSISSLPIAWQVSATRNALVTYSVQVAITSTVASGNVAGAIFLEISSDNSTWVEVGRLNNLLNVSADLSHTVAAPLIAFVPAGYFVRLRSLTSSGNPRYNFVSGQETLL